MLSDRPPQSVLWDGRSVVGVHVGPQIQSATKASGNTVLYGDDENGPKTGTRPARAGTL